MNLIDKKELLNERPEMLNPNMNDEIESAYNKGWNACNSEWIGMLDDDPSKDIEYFPTAYDVDKVIDELMERYHSCDLTKTDGSEYEDGRFDAYNDAIEIVKRGGVE